MKIDGYFNRIIDAVQASIYWKDLSGVYVGCNKYTLEMAGLYDRTDFLGKTDYELPWKEIADELKEIDQRVITTQSVLTLEETPVLANNRKVTFLTTKTPLYDEHNELCGIIGISVDITERKKMEEELLAAKEKAESANIAKTNLTRNLDHSILTPFSGVYSLLEVLEKQETDPEKKEYLHMAHLSAKELLELCQHMLDSMRVTSNDDPVLEMKVDLKELLESIIKLDYPATHNKHLELIFHYPSDLPTVFLTDAYRLKRIVMNLVDNAIKFTEKGYLKLSVELGKQLDDKNFIIKILVEDTGIGIAPENHDYIYQTFSRINPANMGKYAGLGLGLFTTKHFIQDLGGEIDLVSSLEKGSTFICTLPMKRPLLDEILHHNDDVSLN